MKCLFKNECKKKYICCNYCKNPQCAVRCKDKHEDCKFFYNIPGDIDDPEFCFKKPCAADEVKIEKPAGERRGRGRPKKIVDDVVKTESSVKRGRGRPKKNIKENNSEQNK